MTKTRILHILSLIGKIVGLVTATGSIPILPQAWAIPIFFAASLLKDVVNRIGDYLDDGQENQSFKT